MACIHAVGEFGLADTAVEHLPLILDLLFDPFVIGVFEVTCYDTDCLSAPAILKTLGRAESMVAVVAPVQKYR